MARWRLSRSLDALLPFLRSRATAEIARVHFAGSFEWLADPVFRPTVGLFVDGQLRAVSPTWRVPNRDAQDRPWLCRFKLTAPDTDLPPGEITVQCLENGETIAHEANVPVRASAPPRSVLDLIALARSRAPALDTAGFTTFLSLGAEEQLSLLYHTILGRGLKGPSEAAYLKLLDQREISILTIRDRLIASDEFREERLGSTTPPFGHWIVWSGLKSVAPHLLPNHLSNAPEGQIAPGVTSPPVAANLLARNAVGDDASEDVIASWKAAHAEQIAAFASAPSLRNELAVPYHPPRAKHDLALGHFLDSMQVGAAGVRSRQVVRVIPGAAKDVLFGPYLLLGEGRYRVGFKVMFAPSAEGVKGYLSLEVVSGEVILACGAIEENESDRQVELDFVVSPLLAKRGDKCEFRVRSSGEFTGEVRDIVLRRLSPAGVEAGSHGSCDLLSILSAGAGGTRAGLAIVSRPEQAGHVFYGPYRVLLPGVYMLTLALSVTAPPGTECKAVLEVVDAKQQPIARQDVLLSHSSLSASLPFTIPPPSGGMIPDQIEVRLHKDTGVAIMVTGVVVSGAEPESSASRLATA